MADHSPTVNSNSHSPPPEIPSRRQSAKPSKPLSQRRPTTSCGACTHITMNLLHDHGALCDLCHRPSRFGFLYKCHQDAYIKQATMKYHQEFPKPEFTLGTETDQLRAINMSASVIAQVEQGDVYTPTQIETLKHQKRYMLNVLRLHQAMLPVKPRCSMKCCPTCRPYLRDRVPYSFDSIFAGEIGPVQPDRERLPVKSAKVLSQLGLKPARQMIIRRSSHATCDADEETDDDISISDEDDDDDDDDGNEGRVNAETHINSSDGTAVTEESVELDVPDIVEVSSVSFALQSLDCFDTGL